jgi:hypothetical protein
MGSVVRRMRKRRRCLGEGRVLRRGEYQGLELNTKVELIRSLIPLGLRTLTLHRLGVDDLLGISFKTTNCIESANALVEERCSKVDAWKTSHQRHRWLATALLDIEPRLRRVRGHRHLPVAGRAASCTQYQATA